MSRHPEGRRGRGRKPDPAEETATWLLEMEQQAGQEDEEWAQQLRSTRAASGSSGQFPAVPVEGAGGVAPQPPRRPSGEYSGELPAQPPGGYPAEAPPQPYSGYAGEAPPTPRGGYPAEAPPQPYGGYAGEAPAQPYSGYAGEAPGQQFGGYAGEAPPPPHGGYPGEAPAPPGGGYAAEAPVQPYGGYAAEASAQQYGGYPAEAPVQPSGGYAAEAPGQPYGGYAGEAPAQPEAPRQPYGEQASAAQPVHPPLAERYRSASRMPLSGQPEAPPAVPAADPDATAAWTWEPQAPADSGYGGYQPQSGGWEPSAPPPPPLPQAPLDPRPAPAPWDDPTFGAAVAPEPQPWDTTTESEPWSGAWPFEETTQSWEADDRSSSWRWPTQEVPSGTGSWEVDQAAWQDAWGTAAAQPQQQPGRAPQPSAGYPSNGYPEAPGGFSGYDRTDPGASSGPLGAAGPTALGEGPAGYGSAAAGSLGAAGTAAPGGVAPAGAEPWTGEPTRGWYQQEAARPAEAPSGSGEFASVLEDEEQVVRLGRAAGGPDSRGPGQTDSLRIYPGRSARSGEARRFQPSGEHRAGRSNWPRVVALISWIVLLMVVCWFYVFPWLERILPENF